MIAKVMVCHEYVFYKGKDARAGTNKYMYNEILLE